MKKYIPHFLIILVFTLIVANTAGVIINNYYKKQSKLYEQELEVRFKRRELEYKQQIRESFKERDVLVSTVDSLLVLNKNLWLGDSLKSVQLLQIKGKHNNLNSKQLENLMNQVYNAR